MEPFPQLTVFYKTIVDDARIGVTHIILYMALLQLWNINGGTNPVRITRADIMKGAKINARFTYNKWFNNLQEFGHITYWPASNPFSSIKVYLKGL